MLRKPKDQNYADQMVKKYQSGTHACSNSRNNWRLLGFLVFGVAKNIPCSHGLSHEIRSRLPVVSEEPEPELQCTDNNTKVWNKTPQTVLDFPVAGVNLGLYGQTGEGNATKHQDTEPFELFDDFNIENLIRGNEGWQELLEYRRLLERPSLSFYVDKVARKRWLPSIGIKQPRFFALLYDDELGSCRDLEEEEVILSRLPARTDYVAKPSHHSSSSGVWLVGHDMENDITIFTSTAERRLKAEQDFDQMEIEESLPEEIAESLAENLHEQVPLVESWALRNVKPGIVIEERFTDIFDAEIPPLEFCIFTIWGRVWLAEMNELFMGEDRQSRGFVHRDRTMADGSYYETFPFDWVDWERLVDTAERLGANKDMFRTDIFVGIPAGWSRPGATEEERLTAVEYVVSESEIFPTTEFEPEYEMTEEGARLWIAGYKSGNYRSVPNTEVPQKFLELGAMPLKDEFTACVERKHPNREWDLTPQTLMQFDVAGVNLGLYGLTGGEYEMEEPAEVEPFELYGVFNIEDQIKGTEDWYDLKNYKRNMQRTQTTYYHDKVTLKRWLTSIGISIPPLFALKHASELTESGELEDEKKAILELLPKDRDYVAKPTHKAEGYDVWIVRHNTDGTVSVSKDVGEFEEHEDFDHEVVAESLAKALHERPDDWESWSLLHVRPGIVVESLITPLDTGNTELDADDEPDDEPAAIEFKFVVIWGRVWTAQWVQGKWRDYFDPGFVHRNGTMVEGSVQKSIPGWVDWSHMVDIAERLGAHKDLFRVEIFPGVPAGSPALREGATKEERLAAVEYYVSEVEITPDQPMTDELSEEAARLWIAGYKMGNYRIVPNEEFPSEYDYKNSSLPAPDGVDAIREYWD